MPIKKVALLGNPNCGKTTLFNLLTGHKQKIGNWPGVTVEKKTGQFTIETQTFELIDLPGIYSLCDADNTDALDATIARQYFDNREFELVINIIDASNLKRNLYLTLQCLERNIPCIIALNMMDTAKEQNIKIDVEQLSKQLNCPVVPLVCTEQKGIDTLKQYLLTSIKSSHFKLDLPNQIHQSDDPELLIADQRYQAIDTIIANSVNTTHAKPHRLTEIIDSVVMHRVFGIPIFLLIMYLIFEFSMNVGTLLQPLFDMTTQTLFVDAVAHYGPLLHFPNWLTIVLSRGIGLGINTIAAFLPQIALLFLSLSFLEDSGYMARAAFVMDRFMQSVGLPGQSFIPLIIGFGCNVPAIMATRTLEKKSDRILTTLMAPFMSCGARLAIYAVFVTAFFPHHGGSVVFALYLIGILAALLTGFLLKHTLVKTENTPFIMELPKYHQPHFKSLLQLSWQRTKGFLFRAGRMIIPVTLLIGVLNTLHWPKQPNLSVLAKTSQVITPVFKPMGITENNWPATVGLVTGTLAKEVVVGTLNTLYTPAHNPTPKNQFNLFSQLKMAWTETITGFSKLFSKEMLNPFTANEAEHNMSRSAIGAMSQAFTSQAAAFAYLLFVLLYIPCISTISVIAREIGKGWAAFSTFWGLSLAYTMAVGFYQTTLLSEHFLNASIWIIGLISWQIILYLGLRTSLQWRQTDVRPA